jgi:hypothetical protein
MSFKEQRIARQERQSNVKSYVVTPSTGVRTETSTSFRSEDQSDADINVPSVTHIKEGPKLVPRDGMYASIPMFLELRTSAGSGRGLWTNTGIKQGIDFIAMLNSPITDRTISRIYCSLNSTTRISAVHPIPVISLLLMRITIVARTVPAETLHAMSHPALLQHSEESSFILSSNRVKVSIVTQECQNDDWRLHKRECAAMQRWAAAAPSQDASVPGEAVRCLGRVLFRKQKGPTSVWVGRIVCILS